MSNVLWMLATVLAVVGCDNRPPAVAAPPEPASAPAPAASQPSAVTPPGQTTSGREAFISVGGVTGYQHTAVLSSLTGGYQRAGFRVHYVVEAMSFAPFSTKMTEVAQEYAGTDRRLKVVVFHHTGHGWGDHFSYQAADGSSGVTRHSEVAAAVAAAFPLATPQFASMNFGLIYDACGQGRATQYPVAQRSGWIATSTPDAATDAQCQQNNCPYTCRACESQIVAAYVYSSAFGANLQSPADDTAVIAVVQAAHDAGLLALVAAASPSCGIGKFERY